MVQLLNFFFFITFMVVLCGTAAPVLFQWFVSRDVSTGAPFFNGTLIPILISEFPFLVYLHSKKFIRSMDRAKSGVLVRASRPILFKYLIGKSSSARNALFCFVLVLHFLIIESMGDLSYLESFCGLSCLQFFCTIFSLPRERSAKRERRRLWSFGNEQRRNDKMRCPNRRVEGPVAFPVRFARARYSLIFSRIFASSSGAGVPPEIGLEALALPTSRLQMAVGHDYYPKVKINLPISHGGVCIFLLGVLLSNTNKIQFTQRLPLGSELHMGKERCCLRGLDHLHGPTFHSICGNFMLSKPDRLHDESLRADLLPANGKLEFENIRYPHLLYREDEQLLNSLNSLNSRRELSTTCQNPKIPTGFWDFGDFARPMVVRRHEVLNSLREFSEFSDFGELSNNLSGIEQLRLLILSLEKMSYNLRFSSMENMSDNLSVVPFSRTFQSYLIFSTENMNMSDNLPVVPSGYLIFSNPQHWWMNNNGFEKIFSIENIFSNLSHNNLWFTMFPEKRYFFSLRETTSTTEVAIHTNLFTDLYALIGTGSSRTGGWYTTIMKLPFIFSIWIGFLLASLGGLRSLLRQLQKEKLHWN